MGAISAVTPILGALSTASQVIGLATNSRQKQSDLALKQLQAQQQLQQQQQAQNAALERERLAAQGAQDDASRRRALRRAVARQKALFGAQGIGSGDGSSEAVLLGLFEESDEEREAREKMDSLRSRALDMGLEQSRSLNLLQSTQLAQRQKLQSVF